MKNTQQQKKVSHLLYMYDWKLTGTTEEVLQQYKQAVRTFRENIHMEFGLDIEIQIECQEQNNSNWSIRCSSIKIQSWYY